jgi:DNA-binding response OmpR family regulator
MGRPEASTPAMCLPRSGLIAPGLPNIAIRLGEKFGRLMNYGDGVYAAWGAVGPMKDTFDLMMLDVRLPDGSGIDLLQQLQLRPQRPLVVMMTGFGSVESAVDCMRNGAFDYLIKPFEMDHMLEVVARGVATARADERSGRAGRRLFLSRWNENRASPENCCHTCRWRSSDAWPVSLTKFRLIAVVGFARGTCC